MMLRGIKRIEGFLIKACQKNNHQGILGNNFHNLISLIHFLEIIFILYLQERKLFDPHQGKEEL